MLEGRRFAACGSGRASRAYNYLNVDVNATYCRTPLRGSGRRFAALVIMQRCYSNATCNSRLCARRFAARHPSIVQRCCAALLARFAGSGSCAAVAARSPRSAGRGRWSVAVATPIPASRVFARSRRCCGSPPGSRSRPHPRPYPALTLNPYTILKFERFKTPHPPKTEKGILELGL